MVPNPSYCQSPMVSILASSGETSIGGRGLILLKRPKVVEFPCHVEEQNKAYYSSKYPHWIGCPPLRIGCSSLGLWHPPGLLSGRNTRNGVLGGRF